MPEGKSHFSWNAEAQVISVRAGLHSLSFLFPEGEAHVTPL